MIKKLILMLILLLVAATVQAGVIVDEDFSSYADTSFIGADFGTPGPTGHPRSDRLVLCRSK